jgi:hypothetical protein
LVSHIPDEPASLQVYRGRILRIDYMSKNRAIIRKLGILQVKATLTGYKSYRGILGLKFFHVRVRDSDLGHKVQVQEADIDRA